MPKAENVVERIKDAGPLMEAFENILLNENSPNMLRVAFRDQVDLLERAIDYDKAQAEINRSMEPRKADENLLLARSMFANVKERIDARISDEEHFINYQERSVACNHYVRALIKIMKETQNENIKFLPEELALTRLQIIVNSLPRTK